MKKLFPLLLLSMVILSGILFINTQEKNIQEVSNEVSGRDKVGSTPTLSHSSAIPEVKSFSSFEEKYHELRALKHPDEIHTFIENLEREIERDKMIFKLNNGTASEVERELFAKYLNIRNESYQVLIDMKLLELEKEYL